MIEEQKEIQKLARIQRELIDPAREEEDNTDIIIKIRNGVIVWAETSSVTKIRVDFKELI